MDPLLGEFIGEMKEFKRMSVDRFDKIDSKLEALVSWKIKVAASAGTIGALIAFCLRLFLDR